ncbi:MAG: Exodeoxyribonuclease III [uncultured Acidimicrobiales bacterium]|uniref:Exodeoxyribonuclease III n=1 Tax=uncultured Acidimicrobiales bacterium TaxID=310071 RepID=A0A6J4HL25_9ACTN|nr:MAG: Exodeoxyribonuclease III [uncultured Acidimicrobiales bacterium]
MCAGTVPTVRVATWNVNSLKARMPRVEEWLAQVGPDVLCLQETKSTDKAFPAMAFSSLGYESVHHGEGRWNGVAIVSRVGIDDVVDGFAPGIEPDPEARLLTATCGGVRVATVYVPNGRHVGHEQWHHKLGWMERLRAHLDATADPTGDALVLGDFNVAPDDRDVWDPTACHGGTHVSPEERDALRSLCEWGLVDVFRRRHQEDRLFTWWDYRAGAFHKHLGMRIDLLLATAPLADRLSWVLVDRNARKGSQPSDHAPLVAEFTPAG